MISKAEKLHRGAVLHHEQSWKRRAKIVNGMDEKKKNVKTSLDFIKIILGLVWGCLAGCI